MDPRELLAQAILNNNQNEIQQLLKSNQFSSKDLQDIYRTVVERLILAYPNQSNKEKAATLDQISYLVSLGAPTNTLIQTAFRVSTDPLLYLVLRRLGVKPTPEEEGRFNAIINQL